MDLKGSSSLMLERQTADGYATGVSWPDRLGELLSPRVQTSSACRVNCYECWCLVS